MGWHYINNKNLGTISMTYHIKRLYKTDEHIMQNKINLNQIWEEPENDTYISTT